MAQTMRPASFGPFCFLAAVATFAAAAVAAASCRCGGSEVDERRNEPKQRVSRRLGHKFFFLVFFCVFHILTDIRFYLCPKKHGEG